MYRIHWLSRHDPPDAFPDAELALRDPDGLLAAGGDLSVERLLAAYERGIFPWYEEGQPVLWWSPDPRAVLRPGGIHVSRSLRRSLRRAGYTVTWNQAFRRVMAACAEPRSEEHTSELQSLRGISYAVFCLKKKEDNVKRMRDSGVLFLLLTDITTIEKRII